ncbi:hypothetical protein CVT24_004328 [Panaeolus cyanescens]|uniref:Uncharacterized protein n=1 Tax=Panaeolus cyanescens TaxID=181874 RepID=A0A409VAB0_9AGAR|nr:hypothetical protein CVT24_004328 [Panaeolus cyanescens]
MFSSPISIPLGIVAGLLASCIQSLGLTIQRKSHVQNQSLPEHRQRVEHKRPLWLLGFAIFISSNVVGSLVQIASLPVVILAPLGAVSLLWNAFFARLLLGDVFSPWMILGTILIAGGAILIAFFGIVPEQTRSLEDLLALLRRPPFIVYFSILTFVVFVSLAVSHLVEFSLARQTKIELPLESPPLDLSPSSVTINLPNHTTQPVIREIDTTSSPTEQSQLIDRKPAQSLNSLEPDWPNGSDPHLRTKTLLAISYSSFSGIISGMCLIFAKSGVELLLLTLTGHNQFWRWESWVLLIILVAFALLQLWYMHKALVLADPTLVCPSAFCFYNLSSIVNGLVYFDQISLIKPLHLGLVVLGIFVLLGGVWIVSIQSGGGGVDVGSWNEEGIQLPGEDIAIYSEPEPSQEISVPDTESPLREPTVLSRPPRSRIGAVPMERETRSESSVPHESSLTGLGLDLGSEASSMAHRTAPIRAETQLYATPRTPSRMLGLRRDTVDGRPSLSGSATTAGMHHRTVSHPLHAQGQASHGPLTPPLGSVSTLGAGFQIGLSPVSPGFTIMPLERRRRPSGMGNNTGSPSLDGLAHEVMSRERRRRTVSDSEAPRRIRDENSEVEGLARETDTVNSGEMQNGPKLRWRWIRDMLLGKKE